MKKQVDHVQITLGLMVVMMILGLIISLGGKHHDEDYQKEENKIENRF